MKRARLVRVIVAIVVSVCAVASTRAAATARENLLEAKGLYAEQRYSEARTAFMAIARTEGDTPETDFYLGRLALWFDEEAVALTHLERGVKAAPQSARLHNALGDACGLAAQNASLLAKLGWARKCLVAYRRAVELEPENIAWRWSLVGYYGMAPGIAGGGVDKARAEAEEIGRRDPASGRAALATVCLLEKRFAEAFAQFDPILRERPDDFLGLYHVGRCAALSGQQLERGRAALQRCLSLEAPAGDGMPSRASVYHRLGNVLEKLGDAVGARDAYARAAQESPDFRPAKVALKN